MEKIILKLFKRVVGDYSGISERALKAGILMPNCPDDIVSMAIDLYGKDGALYNSLFHKSFKTVEDSSTEQLLFQQIFHYLTTYGSDFQSEYIYIPEETFNIPGLNPDKVKLVNIKTCTIDELVEKIKTLCSVPLDSYTASDAAYLLKKLDETSKPGICKQIVNEISNKEVKCLLCDMLGVLPSDPNEFLRYMIYLTTGLTLKIKNKATIALANCKTPKSNKAFLEYTSTRENMENLASIFNRDKDLILAFKNPETRKIINKLNKLAKKMRFEKLKDKLIEHVTDTNYPIGDSLQSSVAFIRELVKTPVRKELALLKALDYRLAEPEFIEYRIRNGKSWFAKAPEKDLDVLRARREAIADDVVSKLHPVFAGKTFIVPDNIDYALPLSEKDFTGEIPNKTVLKTHIEDALIIAVCWDTECDIDLSFLDSTGYKIGWNGYYKSADGFDKVLFSGDMTRLDPQTKKASEALYIEGAGYTGTVKVNLFSNISGKKVIPFKFVIAKSEKLDRLDKNSGYAIDPENVIAQFNMQFSPQAGFMREMTLGTLTANTYGDYVTFTFDSGNGGSSHVSYRKEADIMRQSVAKVNAKNVLKFANLVSACGGRVVPESKANRRIPKTVDLTLENLSKESFFKIFETQQCSV